MGTAIAITAWSNLASKVNYQNSNIPKPLAMGVLSARQKNVATKAFANGVTLSEMSRILSE
jgi:hypothetical protein